MPLSVFRGQRKPGDGWTRKDAQAAILLLEYEDSVCPGCGNELRLTTDVRVSEQWLADPICCHACATRDVVAKRVAENGANQAPGAYRYRVSLKPGADKYIAE